MHKLTESSTDGPPNFLGPLDKSGMPGGLPELLQVLQDNESRLSPVLP